MDLSVCLSVCQSVSLSVCLAVCLSVLSVHLQAWKRSNATRFPQCFNFTTSKTQQLCETSSTFELDIFKNVFCETSSILEIDNIKNEAILRDFLQEWKVECRAELTTSCQCVLRFFQSMSLRNAPATKNWCQVIRSAAPVTQNHLSKPEDLMLQNATRLRKSAPWPPNISDEHVLCTAPATRHASFQILFKCPTPAIVFGNATRPSRFAHFR